MMMIQKKYQHTDLQTCALVRRQRDEQRAAHALGTQEKIPMQC